MSPKSAIQLIILITIFIIIGGVYFKYFSKEKITVDQTPQQTEKEINTNSQDKKSKIHIGGIYSSDVFYDERPDLNEQMVRHGILGVEMEAAELYNLAARHGCRALAVLTVSDHLQTGEALPPEERQSSFGDMVEIALEAAISTK